MRPSGLLALALVGIIMGIAGMSYWHRRTPMNDAVSIEQPTSKSPHSAPGRATPPLPRPRELRDLLRDSHWSETAAVAVESLTANVWNTFPREFITSEPAIVELLASLGNHEGTKPLLERHPELAPLLASSPEPG